MKCPFCGNSSNKVVDKRETDDDTATRRRRECLKCKKRFTSYERIEALDIYIVKKDGRREQYESEKLRKGLIKACQKRPVSLEDVNKVVTSIEARLKEKNKSEIPSKIVGELIMKALKKLDKVAYIRFASVYREFEDLSEFKAELKKLDKK